MIPLITAYILNIIDYIFTAHWVRKFGVEIEANPLARWMFSHDVAWVFKIFVVGVFFAVLGYFIKRNSKTVWVAYILLAVYAFLVVYHVIILFKIK